MVKNHFHSLAVLFFVLLTTLVACKEKATQVMPTIPGARETEVYLTVVVQFTQEAAAFTQIPTPLPTPTVENIPAVLATELPTSTVEPVIPTSLPEATSTSTPRLFEAGTRIWMDDFEGEKNWYTETKEDSYTFEFLNGAYRIYNNLLGSIVWSIRGDSYADVRLEVDAMKQKGPKDGYYGLICRYVDSKNYYALVIGGDNTFGIVKMKESKLSFIQQGELQADLLKTKDEYNRLRADCIGANLALYVNDEIVIETIDSDFTAGDVGIGVGNQLKAVGIDVVFDNFEIWQP